MAQVKNTFLKSKMNKDLDSRILPNGEYRDAQNVSVSKSEGADVGSLENVLSNELLSTFKSQIIDIEVEKSTTLSSTTPATSAQIENSLNKLDVIGQFADTKNNRMFFMLTNFTDTSNDRLSNFASPDKYDIISVFPPPIVIGDFIYKGAGCYICMYDFNANQSSILVGGRFLNFSKTHKVESINILEDLLFFTDNRNQPRKINITNAVNQPFSSTTPYYTTEDNISVSKFAPVLPISLVEEVSALNWESTMKSKGEEYLPIHLIDTLPGSGTGVAVGTGGTQIVLNRSVTWGDKTKMVCEGDKFTIPDPPGNDLEFTVSSYGSGASPGTTFNFTPPTPEDIPDGAIVKFQRPNPDYDADYKGDEKVLKDKFQRFSYRFKYDDNEYSLFAPFTQETFIPQQHGYFINDDDEKSGKSGIVDFMENLVDNIKFNIRLPYNGDELKDKLKVKEIQIVSKASDELAIKVIEDIPIEDLASFSDQDYYYEYNSIKPYKTLPDNEITRVHDRVPVRALCQEVTGSRVMYGNFVDKHTSPNFLDYQLKVSTKNLLNTGSGTFNQIKKEYPNHTLKQNRTYTVGVVLIDRYGRSSNVILSKQNVSISTDKVSTIYSDYSNFGSGTIADWPGELLEVNFNNLIPSSGSAGYPGLYSFDNPLGWYSYKIVVKQQEQEYYNVYLPGVLAGEIKWSGSLQPTYQNGNTKSTISLYGDNINKVPRNLNEVGPTDRDFGSSTVLYNRVNPNSWDTNSASPAPSPNETPYSTQSSVGKKPDTIDFIKPFKELGDWANSKGNLYPSDQNLVFDPASPPTIAPWYPFVGGIISSRIFTDPLFRSNENPFIAVLSTQAQTGVTPIADVSGTPNEFQTIGPNRLGDTSLGVYETEPTSTELELFWETSTAGLITSDSYIIGTNQYDGLNDLIESGAAGNGPFNFSSTNFTLSEEDPSGTPATNYFECVDSAGNPCADVTNTFVLNNVTDGYGNNRTPSFEIEQDLPTNPTKFRILSKKGFIFNNDANIRENYTFFIDVTANGQTNTLSFNGLLSNAQPVNSSFPNYFRIDPTYPTYVRFAASAPGSEVKIVENGELKNGSILTTRDTEELVYSIDFTDTGVDYSSFFNYWTEPNGDVKLQYLGGISYSSPPTFSLTVQDANGNGGVLKNIPFNVQIT